MESWNTFVDRVGQRFGQAGPEDLGQAGPEDLESSVAVALTGVGRYLPEIDRKHIELPAKAAEYLRSAELEEGELDVDVIGEDLGMPAGQGREFVESVLAAIDEQQTGEARQHWKRNLPGELAEALKIKSGRPPAGGGTQTGHTLADGIAGSRSPMATADHGHSGSPIAGGEPHGNTKLSSSQGTTQERLGHTLAEGKAGSTRPLSEESGD